MYVQYSTYHGCFAANSIRGDIFSSYDNQLTSTNIIEATSTGLSL